MIDRACVPKVVVTMTMLFMASGVQATTYNSPTVDGLPPSPAVEGSVVAERDSTWAADELLVEEPLGDSAWGPNNDLQGVWVTWDDEGITFSVQGALWDTPSGVGANSANLYLDVDFGQGTGYGDLATLDAEALDAITRNFWRPLVVEGGFGVDWGYTTWSGRFDLGFLDVSDPDAPVNLFEGVSGQTDAVNESPEGVIEARDLDGNSGYELFVPWEVFYPEAGPGRVPSGTQIALVVAQVGGGDSLSPESIPDGADDRLIERPVVFTVDGDGDGIPDRDWPPNGTISGDVTLADAADTTTVVEVVARPLGEDAIVGRAETPPGGGAYVIDRLQPGDYEVEVNALDLCAPPKTATVIEDEVATADFTVDEAESGIAFTLGFADGPEATEQLSDIQLRVTRQFDGRVVTDQLLAPGDDLDFEFRLCDADYRIEAFAVNPDPAIDQRTGYTSVDRVVPVSGLSIVDLGSLAFQLVQPTRLAFADARSEDGAIVQAIRIPKSEPLQNSFVRGPVEVVAVDDEGREAWLTDDLRGDIELRLTSIDPRFPTEGAFDFWTTADTTQIATQDDTPSLATVAPTTAGRTRARFLLSGDTREIARLRARHPSATIETGNLEVQITSQLPAGLDLALATTSLVAGDSSTVTAAVLDVLGENIREEDLEVGFVVTPANPEARVAPNPALTDPQGNVGNLGNVVFTSTVADTFEVVATVSNGLELVESDPVQVLVAPAAAARLELQPQISGLTTVEVPVQVIDRFGNAIEIGSARTAQVEVGPAELIDTAPTSVDLEADGAGSFTIDIQPDLPGVLQIAVTDPTLPEGTTTVDFELLAGLTGIDEAAPESTDPNSLPDVDLTTLSVQIRTDAESGDDEFVFTLPFSSGFNGMHLGLALEVEGSTTGGTSDPFVFPITFTHEFLPDFALTYKYSANDYGDFRRWNVGSGSWEWYDWANEQFVAQFTNAPDISIVDQQQVSKEPSQVVFRLPVSVVAPGFRSGVDSLRAQVYLMQEEDQKRKPYDSIPEDQTLDMIIGDTVVWNAFGDPDTDPGATDRLIAYLTGTDGTGNTELDEYVTFSPRRIGNTLTVEAVDFVPETTTQNEELLITIEPGFPPGEGPPNPIFQVFADLSPLGGDRAVRMNDDGTNGDVTAGDGVFTTTWTVPATQFAGQVDIVVRTLELTTAQEVFTSGSVEVIGDPELVPLISLEDAAGDDHGPNQPDEDFLFYEAPTNGVFFDGVFDLRQLDVFDLGDQLLFQVTLGDLTDPAETSAADWGATYPSNINCPEGQRTDLNLQNVVILLDTKDGVNIGSTEIPENRHADIAPQDAWEYAMVFDGWWKGMVRSNGTSNAGGWNILAADEQFFFCASARTNTITGFVSKDVFEPEELDEILTWDLIVMLSGHDGDSNDDNWGGVRWVNDDVSEWQFGGGRNSEDGRERDPNIIDLMALSGLTRPGAETRKPEGRPQEQQMNYLTPEARARFAREERVASVQLEATAFRDEEPPRVEIVGAAFERAVVPKAVLQDGPVVVRADITDDSGIENARMFWWAPGESPAQRREVPMGKLRGDLDPASTEFAGDIPWRDVAEATDTGELDDPDDLASMVRYINVTIEATDIAGNSTVPAADTEEEQFAAPFVVELPVNAVTEIRYEDLLAGNDPVITIDLNEGSQWQIERSVLEQALPDSTARLDLVLKTVPVEEVDRAFRTADNETVLGPDNRFLGIARHLELEVVQGVSRRLIRELPENSRLSIHFPRYLQGDEHPGELSLFRREEIDPETDRWILVSGHGETDGSTVTILTKRLGAFAGFTAPVEIDPERYVTGLVVTPNPFTPNGDGLYDEVDISYVLPEATNWAVVEIFDIQGERVRVLQKFRPDDVINRTLSLTWDGRDETGRLVPMGIYVVRVEVENKNEVRVERATRAVAVVR